MLRKLFKDIGAHLKRYICDLVSHLILITSLIKQYVAKMLPRYDDIFWHFTAISFYRESRYNDTSI